MSLHFVRRVRTQDAEPHLFSIVSYQPPQNVCTSGELQ